MNARYAWRPTVAALSGCVRQYLSPQFDPSGAQFKGVASYLHDASAVQVVFVHGMCTHSEDKWVNQVWEPQILDALEAVIGEKKLEARECTQQSKYCIVPRSILHRQEAAGCTFFAVVGIHRRGEDEAAF